MKRILALAILSLSACEPAVPVASDFIPEYRGVQTRLLDGDLVQFEVTMTKAQSTENVGDYAECAAAQYALIRGYGFARHVRTNVVQEGSIWRGDAVYTCRPGSWMAIWSSSRSP